MQRHFNTAGPCIPEDHYMINAASRLTEVMPLIEQRKYFVIHAARQSGKTTFLLDLAKRLNNEGRYYALYCSLESVQEIADPKEGIPAVVKSLKLAFQTMDMKGSDNFAKNADYSDYSNVLTRELSILCNSLDKPLIILFDEADCLSEGTLISFLRQLRKGYNTRSISPFVHSLALVGMRNISDYKARVRPDSETLGGPSPFNIVTEAFTLHNFSREKTGELYAQHTAETGQVFDEAAIERVWQQTQGQPWLVNAIARDVIYKILNYDFTRPVTVALVDNAIERIIMRRDTHIGSLLERLKEERIRKVIEPMITGGNMEVDRLSDDYRYVRDLGLIRDDRNITEPANPIYAEVIVRTLSYDSQKDINSKKYPYEIPRYMRDGKFDMDFMLTDFQQFWRENSAIWAERYEYKEAAPHLILQAFMQRIINGGGHIVREMSVGRQRIDLCVVFRGQKYPVEVKVRYSEKTYDDGIEQTARYMDSLGCTRGWLIVFDRRENIDWDTKIFTRTENLNRVGTDDWQSPDCARHEPLAQSENRNKTIIIIGC